MFSIILIFLLSSLLLFQSLRFKVPIHPFVLNYNISNSSRIDAMRRKSNYIKADPFSILLAFDGLVKVASATDELSSGRKPELINTVSILDKIFSGFTGKETNAGELISDVVTTVTSFANGDYAGATYGAYDLSH